ncbi:MAG: CHRD domain-containing protein [Fluviibacter sp.]
MQTKIKYGLAVALLGAVMASPVGAETIHFVAHLTPQQEVPAVKSRGMGEAKIVFDTANDQLTWHVAYKDLTGPVTAAHFHGPAMRGEKAGVAVGFKGSMDNPIQGSAMLNATQVSELFSGKWYVNLHTAQYPAGEIRGQVEQR